MQFDCIHLISGRTRRREFRKFPRGPRVLENLFFALATPMALEAQIDDSDNPPTMHEKQFLLCSQGTNSSLVCREFTVVLVNPGGGTTSAQQLALP